MKLIGKNAVVTGGSKGLGFAVVKRFLEEGANVIFCGRNKRDVDFAYNELWKLVKDGQFLNATYTDVGSAESVKDFFSVIKIYFGNKIDILVNNAGEHGAVGLVETCDEKEFLSAVKTNLMGSFHTCKEVLPIMKENDYGKIIQLSGGGATSPMPTMSAYAASKAAVVRFAETLAKETEEYNISVNSVAPGILETRLIDQILDNESNVDPKYYEKVKYYKENGCNDMSKAVDLIVWLASDDSENLTGKLISAQWDNWELLTDGVNQYNTSNVFTLRRITGRDAGYKWLDHNEKL